MIEFGEVKMNLFILLIYPVGIIIARSITNHFIANPQYYLFLFFISHFLTLIPLIIYKTRKIIYKNKKIIQKKLDNIDNNSRELSIDPVPKDMKNQIEVLKEKIKKDKKRDKILLFFLIAILYFLTYVFFYYFNYITPTNFYGNVSMITEVLYFSLFNWTIFGNKIYSHHCFSMILITVSIFALYILLIIKYMDLYDCDIPSDIIYPSLLNLVVYGPFCFFLVKGKAYIEKYFISIYELILFLGILCLSILIIFEPISFFISCEDKKHDKMYCYEDHFAGILSGFKQASNVEGLFYSLGLVISLFMTTLGLWLTVKILSPFHFLTSDSIITFELNILMDCHYGHYILVKDPLFYILSFITIFACLIYNEIIIINIYNLDYNTRKQIIKRQSKDLKTISCELPEYIERLSTNNCGPDNNNGERLTSNNNLERLTSTNNLEENTDNNSNY